MASDISTSISTQVSVIPVTPKPTAILPSANIADDRQTIAERPGQVVPPVAQTEEKSQSINSEEYELKEAVSNLNDYVQNLERDLSFTIDEISGKTVITVTDPESDEVIRQIPSEDLLAIAQHFSELQESEGKGVLIEEQV